MSPIITGDTLERFARCRVVFGSGVADTKVWVRPELDGDWIEITEIVNGISMHAPVGDVHSATITVLPAAAGAPPA